MPVEDQMFPNFETAFWILWGLGMENILSTKFLDQNEIAPNDMV